MWTVDDGRTTVCFAGVVARVVVELVVEPVETRRDIESLRGRMGESTRQALGRACRDLEGLFESLLAEGFGGGE